jgi:hypothetical protein
MRFGWVGALLVLSWPVGAQNPAPASAPAANTSLFDAPVDPLDTPAQSATKKLPRHLLSAKPRRFSEAEKTRIETVTRLDEITVYGYVEPEDYVAPKKAPVMQLRDRLDRDRPMTPWEKIRLPLCLIGLCGMYGPDGLPREPSLDERSEARINQSTTQLNGQFRGTLQ